MNAIYKNKYGCVKVECRDGATVATHFFPGGIRCVFSRKSGTVTLERRGRVVDVFPFDSGGDSDDRRALLLEVGRIARRKFFFGTVSRTVCRKLKRIRAGYYEIKFITK